MVGQNPPNPGWQEAVDPLLLQRLMGPLTQPGVIGRQVAESRYSRICLGTVRVPMLAGLLQRLGHMEAVIPGDPQVYVASWPSYETHVGGDATLGLSQAQAPTPLSRSGNPSTAPSGKPSGVTSLHVGPRGEPPLPGAPVSSTVEAASGTATLRSIRRSRRSRATSAGLGDLTAGSSESTPSSSGQVYQSPGDRSNTATFAPSPGANQERPVVQAFRAKSSPDIAQVPAAIAPMEVELNNAGLEAVQRFDSMAAAFYRQDRVTRVARPLSGRAPAQFVESGRPIVAAGSWVPNAALESRPAVGTPQRSLFNAPTVVSRPALASVQAIQRTLDTQTTPSNTDTDSVIGPAFDTVRNPVLLANHGDNTATVLPTVTVIKRPSGGPNSPTGSPPLIQRASQPGIAGVPVVGETAPPSRRWPEVGGEHTLVLSTYAPQSYAPHSAAPPTSAVPGPSSNGGSTVQFRRAAGLEEHVSQEQIVRRAPSPRNGAQPARGVRTSTTVQRAPAAEPDPALGQSVDVDDLVEKLLRKMSRRLAIETERRGLV